MRILLLSYYAEKHLGSSAAQNTRFMANGLLARGHDVRVLCAGAKGETITQDGYALTKVPITSREWEKRWLGAWRPDTRVRRQAEAYFDAWQPDVIYVGAWNHLLEYALAGLSRNIPVVQMVHDYSILCLRQWLIDSWGQLCTGPTSVSKCTACVQHSLGRKTQLRESLLSLPIVGDVAKALAPGWQAAEPHRNQVIAEAFTYMKRYREKVSLFIAQSPSVIDVLQSGGVKPSRCRFVPQYIGEAKLRKNPRAPGRPGVERPFRIAYVGRWSAEKGVDLLLDAFTAANTPGELELWIISRNAPAEDIKATVARKASPLRSVRIFDDLSGAAVSETLALTDICVVPSTCMELASRVVLEANAQGVPVIASSTVGNRFVIEDGVNGRVFPSGNGDALRQCIEQVIHQPQVLTHWAKHIPRPSDRDTWVSTSLSVLREAVEITGAEQNAAPN